MLSLCAVFSACNIMRTSGPELPRDRGVAVLPALLLELSLKFAYIVASVWVLQMQECQKKKVTLFPFYMARQCV